MTTMLSLLISISLLQSAGVPSTGQRDTCEIRGRVTEKDTGLPIARAVIRIASLGGQASFTTRTDEEGRYEFTGLQPGQYSGFVDGGEFRGRYPMAALGSPAAPRGPIVLKPGEVRDGVDVALARGLAMTVRVVDEAGEPLSRIRVLLTEAGTRRQISSLSHTTDDRGLLRLFGLQPGRYIVCAEPFGAGLASSGNPDARGRERFLRTCYPSGGEGEPVRLEGADLDGIEIALKRGQTFSVSGIVLDATGAPAPIARLMLDRIERNGSSAQSIGVGADGRFRMSGVVPGDYAIRAEVGGPDRPEHRRDLEAAYVPIHLETSDLEDLVVSMARGVDVAGRITVEDPTAPLVFPPGMGTFLVSARFVDDPLPGLGGARTATATAQERVFILTGMFGRRLLDVANVPRGWYVRSIQYRGKEIIDEPTEFKAGTDPSELQVILSARGATISGRALDDRGNPVPAARVVVLPADLRRWRLAPFPGSVASAAGVFRVGPLRPGDYLVAALPPSIPPPRWDDKDLVARLADAAQRILLEADEERTIEVTVIKEQ
jgi:protocatechuate 3,4-dioxygenase beta subunit